MAADPTKLITTEQVREAVGKIDDAAAAGAVTTADTLVSYIKQLVTADILGVVLLGAIDDAAAAGAVTDVDTIMAYIKQIVTAVIADAGVQGALNDAAAAGAVTDADTLMAYIKQLVTAELAALGLRGTLVDTADDTTDTATMMGILRQLVEAVNNGSGTAIGSNLSVVDLFGDFDGGADPQADLYQAIGPTTASSLNQLLGALDTAAAAGAVTDADSLFAYIKQLITAELAALALRGVLTDTADDTTDTATFMGLIRQIAEAVNNGTGSAMPSNISVVDLFGAFDGGADPQGDVYQALGVDATNSIKALIDAAQAQVGQIARKTVTFAAGSTGSVTQHTLFTVTGTVEVKVYAVCTTVTAIQAGSTISVGIAGDVDGIIAVTNSDNPDEGEIWHDATPDAELELASVVPAIIISDGNDITYDVLVDTIDSGVIEFYCEWIAKSADGAVVAA